MVPCLIAKNTALSFDTTTYLWLLQHFHLEHEETNSNSVYRCAGKTNLVFPIVECIWHERDKDELLSSDSSRHHFKKHLKDNRLFALHKILYTKIIFDQKVWLDVYLKQVLCRYIQTNTAALCCKVYQPRSIYWLLKLPDNTILTSV